jgi:hypothetical protein
MHSITVDLTDGMAILKIGIFATFPCNARAIVAQMNSLTTGNGSAIHVDRHGNAKQSRLRVD